ncbi:MAG: hypothetical protein H0T72_03015 [Chloroflexia bacterium]|nr:hypothetical protein [Chloroflexia bacterium]
MPLPPAFDGMAESGSVHPDFELELAPPGAGQQRCWYGRGPVAHRIWPANSQGRPPRYQPGGASTYKPYSSSNLSQTSFIEG